MFGQHASTETETDAVGQRWERPLMEGMLTHRLPGQALLGIGADVALYGIAELAPGLAAYVRTANQAVVVAIEDIPDGVYEIWQVCEEHGTHKVYAQWEGDLTEDELPILLLLAPVVE